MYLYAELWRFRPAWLELTSDARKQWMDTLLGGLQAHLEAGVEVVGFVTNDGDTPHSSGYDFMAAWRMPNKAAAVTSPPGSAPIEFRERVRQSLENTEFGR